MQTSGFDLWRIDTATGVAEHWATLESEASALRAAHLAERYDEEANSRWDVRPAAPLADHSAPAQGRTRRLPAWMRTDQRRCLWQERRRRSWGSAREVANTVRWMRVSWRN